VSRRGPAPGALSLVEVVFATALLLILLLGAFSALASSRRGELFAREHQAASDAAFRLVDEVASAPFGELVVGVTAHPVPYGPATLPPAEASFFPPNVDDPATPADEARHAMRVIVRDGPVPNDYDGDGAPDLLEVEAIVAWKGADGSNLLVSAQRLRAR
jgi:hypothetical protein